MKNEIINKIKLSNSDIIYEIYRKVFGYNASEADTGWRNGLIDLSDKRTKLIELINTTKDDILLKDIDEELTK